MARELALWPESLLMATLTALRAVLVIRPTTEQTISALTPDGVIVVDGDIDFEDPDTARQRPSFLVNVDTDDELAGIISVSILVGDENEAPIIDAIAGTAWVYETAQDGEAVVEKPAAQTGPGPDDQPISIVANDPEGGDITFSIVSATKVPFAIDSETGALTVELGAR